MDKFHDKCKLHVVETNDTFIEIYEQQASPKAYAKGLQVPCTQDRGLVPPELDH